MQGLNEFVGSTEFWRLLWDKLLLFASGVGVALLTARYVERHRREQALVLELGKLRAQALTRTLGALAHHMALVETVMALPDGRVPKPLAEKLVGASESFHLDLANDLALLDSDVLSAVLAFADEVFAYEKTPEGIQKVSPGELQARHERLHRLRMAALAFLPPIQRLRA